MVVVVARLEVCVYILTPLVIKAVQGAQRNVGYYDTSYCLLLFRTGIFKDGGGGGAVYIFKA